VEDDHAAQPTTMTHTHLEHAPAAQTGLAGLATMVL
jgi:hypothetical protein